MPGAPIVSRDGPPPVEPLLCDACAAPIAGEPSGWGVYLWVRGDERREERAPLCDACAGAIARTTTLARDDDEG